MRSMPAIYLPHGGGPWPWLPADFGTPQGHTALRTWLEALPSQVPRPRAILCVTAHWEAPVATVSTQAAPGLLFDYGGFPAHTYQLSWPAPGAPDVAARVVQLLEAAHIPHAVDAERGLDHGTFVPLSVAWPEADVPVVQMSLVKGLDPAHHLAIGRALRPLRDEGVLIVGSGMSYHDMRGFGGQGRADAATFDGWLGEAMASPAHRADALTAWSQAPAGRRSHPREEHLLPLMVVAGAAEGDAGSLPFRDDVLGVRVSAVRFDAQDAPA
ncbi:MAG: dioxygenase [Alphaproteobacteria bacterium]|nr:dioxygenase [Alphaproteobacteria bacterium]